MAHAGIPIKAQTTATAVLVIVAAGAMASNTKATWAATLVALAYHLPVLWGALALAERLRPPSNVQNKPGGVGVSPACSASRVDCEPPQARFFLNVSPGRAWSAADLVLAGQIYAAAIVTVGLALGQLGLLTRPVALVASAALGLAMLITARLATYALPPACDCREPRTSTTDAVALAQVSIRAAPRAALSLRAHTGARLSLDVTRVTTAILIAYGVLVAWKAVAEPVYEYDTLTYHLMFPARWVQDRAIHIVPTWFGDPAPAYAPSATEVYYTWLMLPLGTDILARCGQFPFWILLLCAAHGLGRELGLRRLERTCVCAAIGLIPALVAQAATAMVDLAFTAHVTATILFALRTGRSRRSRDAVGLVLSLGLMLGTKFIALAYLLPVLPLVLWAAWRLSRRPSLLALCHGQDRGWSGPPARRVRSTLPRRIRIIKCGGPPGLGQVFRQLSHGRLRRVGILAAATIIAAWCGAFWYGRNWLVTGNPVYPLEVKVASVVLFHGAYGRAQMENSVFNVRRQRDPDSFGRTIWESLHSPDLPVPQPAEDGRVPVFHHWYIGPAGFAAALFVVAAVYRLRHTRLRSPGVLFYVCAAATWPIFWYVLPFQQPRFAWAPVVLTILGAAVIARVHPRAPLLLLITTAVVWYAAFAGELGPILTAPMVFWVAAIACAAIYLLAYRHHPRLPMVASSCAAGIGLVMVLAAERWASDPRIRTAALPRWRYMGETWSWIDHHVHGETIAYAGNNVPYFLCGRRLENRVLYVPARLPADGLYHDFASSPEARAVSPPNTSEPAYDRLVMDPQVWVQSLHDVNVRYVMVSAMFPNLLLNYRHDEQGFPIERQWLDALRDLSDACTPPIECTTFAQGNVRIYHLDPELLGRFPLPLQPILQHEIDAFDQLRLDQLPVGVPIPGYPLARPLIEASGRVTSTH